MIKKLLGLLLFTLAFFSFVPSVIAGQGCCSYHGGQSYCDSSTCHWVCSDGTYSPTCMCCTIPRPTIDYTFPKINATWEWTPNRNSKTFDLSVKLQDSTPTRYSVTLNKCLGCDPGPLVDYASPNFYFNDIASGRWYMNVKKEIGSYWSTVASWMIDVPSWYPPPSPTSLPIATTTTPTSSTNDVLTMIISALILLFIGGLAVVVIYKTVVWFISYAKANDWVYGALFWGAIIVAVIIYSLLSNKSSVSTPTSSKYTCNCSKTCPNMTCAEAYYQLQECGCSARDGDGDGIPCEAQCK